MKQILAQMQIEHAADPEAVLEQERQRIAQNLYDELGKHILGLHMNLVQLCRNISQMQLDLQESTCLVMKQLAVVMRSLLTTIRGLKVGVLDKGFCSAVEWQCGEFSRRFDIPCHIGYSSGNINLPKHLSLVLFRALQEAIKNVHLHAQAGQVNVIVNSDAKNVVLTVTDDGIGVVPGCQAMAKSYGLAGMRERIIELGGKVNLCSAPNNGTAVNIEMPLGGRWS